MIVSRDDPFYSPKLRLQDAENKIAELDAAIIAYRQKNGPVSIIEADEPDFRTKTYKFKFTVPFPDSWNILAAGAVEAARSALDQMTFAAAKLSGNTRLQKTQFPISDSLKELNNLVTGRKCCEDVPPAIVALFYELQPYKGGNGGILWALNKLRNSTHTALVPIGFRGANILLRHRASSPDSLETLNPAFDRTKNEIPFARSAIDAECTFEAHPTFNVGFEESEITGRHEAVAFLRDAASEVKHVLEVVERACKRLGDIR